MSMINYASREINCKVVYYGSGLGGKTTNLEYVYSRVNPDSKGKMVSLATETDRTLFFDFLPIDLGEIRGFKTRFHLYTVPGQVYYNASRRLILKGVDGLIFVADSQRSRMEANVEAMHNLYENMESYGYDIEAIPFIIQYNKRDLAEKGIPILSVDTMEEDLNSKLNAPSFEASAIRGQGVGETLKKSLVLTLRHLQKELKWT